MLILTKEEEDGIKLIVLQNPIQLEYVLNVDNTSHRKYLTIQIQELFACFCRYKNVAGHSSWQTLVNFKEDNVVKKDSNVEVTVKYCC